MEHSSRILAGIFVFAVLGGLLVWGTASGFFVDEIADRIEAELGLPLDFDDLSIEETRVTLSGVRAATPDGVASIAAEQMVIDADLMALARRVPGSLHGISLRSVEAHLDLDDPAARDFAARLRGLVGGDAATAGEARTDGDSSDGDSSDGERELSALLAHLDLLRDRGTIAVDDLRLSTTLDGVTDAVVDRTKATVTQAGDGVLATAGSGRSIEGGAFDWDLETDVAARAIAGRLGWTELRIEPLLALAPSLPIETPRTARSTGDVTFEHLGSGDLRLAGEIEAIGLSIDSPKLSTTPLRDLRIGAAGTATWHHGDRRLAIETATLRSHDAKAHFAGDVVWTDDHYSIDLAGTLPTTRCGTMLSAIPADLLGRYRGFSLAGEISGRLELAVDSRDFDATELEIEVDDDCRFREVPELATLDRFDGAFQHTALGADGPIHSFRTGPGTDAWTPIQRVSPFLIQAVLAHEDAGFFRHDGFAVYAMEAALETNLEQGRYVRGASTISMQLAKNLFLSREKTVARKVREVLLTWWLESRLDKDELLELYLNVIEYGPEIYGVRQASLHYFGREPIDLTPAESVFLASILPSPVPSHRQYERGALTARTRGDMDFLLRHMHRKGRIDQRALEFGRAELDDFRFHKGPQIRSPVKVFMGEVGDLPFEGDVSRYQDPQWFARHGADSQNPPGSPLLGPAIDDPLRGSDRAVRTRAASHVIYGTESGLRVVSRPPTHQD